MVGEVMAAAIAPLPRPQDHVDWSWSKRERKLVLAYVTDRRFRRTAYRGYSTCRICDKWNNGSADFTDGVYLWPEGYGHYIDVHGVKPPRDFIEHVLRRG